MSEIDTLIVAALRVGHIDQKQAKGRDGLGIAALQTIELALIWQH
jgi:hypothetical protein